AALSWNVRTRLALLGFLSASSLLLAQGVQRQAAPTPTLLTAIAQGRLLQRVRDLVELGPRTGGTASGESAAAYVARAFTQMGLSPSRFSDPEVLAYEASAWHVRWAGGTTVASAWPFRYSPPIPETTVPVVVLPEAAAAPTARWRHRAIYTTAIGADTLARWANDATPPVVVFTSAGTGSAAPEWLPLGEVARPPSHSVPVFAVNKADALAFEAAEATGRQVNVSLSSRSQRRSPTTVIATLRGARTDRYYLVSAHGDSDSGGPGADDNASGVAALLEAAGILAARVRSGATVLPFSVRFAIWGTEYASSRAYVAREGARLADCLGVINIDEVGTGAARDALYVEGNDVEWNRELLEVFQAVGVEHRGPAGAWPEFTTVPTQGGTDAYSFLPRRYKGTGDTTLRIPSVTVFTAAWNRPRELRQPPGWPTNSGDPGVVITDYSAVYHSAGDRPELTTEREPLNMVRAVGLIGLTIERLAEAWSNQEPTRSSATSGR
ncbi:MAG: M28 family metallopeptidase, partial [Vicinamibacterales bacterium]